MELRKWILKIHLYGGLLCFWYMVIIAISSLQFQHHFEFLNDTNSNEKVLEKELIVQENKNVSELALNIQNGLNIAGWYLPWKTYIDTSGILHTEIENPKTHYLINYYPSISKVQIISKDKGFWSLVFALHGYSGGMPNATFLFMWKIFTYICLIVVTFSIFSGIWLWAVSSSKSIIGLITLSGIIVLSLLLMLYLYFNG